ncbi:hypothetical protein G6F35_017061 [Rhizopus arrhizus]|nr:hypothetical protein G6F35_017061 [Rhizopus arrhizus]
MLEVAADGVDGGDEAGVQRIDEADVGQQQQRGIQAMATEGIGEVAQLLAPGFGHDARVDGVGTFAPVARSHAAQHIALV